jgi:1,4-dihydroxy-2-naphthoate polyprenyltransferase
MDALPPETGTVAVRRDPPPAGPKRWQRWITAARPWGAILSLFPVAWGSLLAVAAGGAAFRPGPFAAAAIAMLCLHHAANMLNDVCDHRRGLDAVPNPASGAISRGWLSDREVLRGAGALAAAGAIPGLWLVWKTGWVLLWIGAAGALLGAAYSAGPWPLKKHALGDAAVFLAFGMLGSLGAWTVQTGRAAWLPAIWAVPFSLQVSAVLHANNWRDRANDLGKHVHTVSGLLGHAGSSAYYRALLVLSFVLHGAFLLAVPLDPGGGRPWGLLLALLALPSAWRRIREAGPAASMERLTALDRRTAEMNASFCALSLAGLALETWLW